MSRPPLAAAAALPLALALIPAAVARAQGASAIDNPRIDMAAYLAVAEEAAAHRESRRVSEEEFLRMSREPGTIVLDARSREKFEQLHVRGALNLPFPDIAVESLERTIPDPATRILIYCNNNFANAEGPFPTKRIDASLNVSTYISLYSYGYRNVYELGPYVDLAESKLPFDGTAAGPDPVPSPGDHPESHRPTAKELP